MSNGMVGCPSGPHGCAHECNTPSWNPVDARTQQQLVICWISLRVVGVRLKVLMWGTLYIVRLIIIWSSYVQNNSSILSKFWMDSLSQCLKPHLWNNRWIYCIPWQDNLTLDFREKNDIFRLVDLILLVKNSLIVCHYFYESSFFFETYIFETYINYIFLRNKNSQKRLSV